MSKLPPTADRDMYHRYKIGNPNSVAAIAAEYGVSESTVRRAIKRYGKEQATWIREYLAQVEARERK